PETKVDIVAYLLSVNGFPAGSTDLPLDAATLDNLQIIRKGADAAGPPNFALVQVMGCLTQAANGRWMLTNSTQAAVTKEETATPDTLKSGTSAPLGTDTFELVSVSPSYKADTHKGHRMD